MSNTRVSQRVGAALLVAGLLLAGCSSDGDDSPPKDGLGCAPLTVESGKAPATPKPAATAPTKVATKDVKAGKGCAFGTQSYASLDMIGVSGAGTVFVDTWKDGRPVSVGAGDLLDALDTAIADMRVGGIRTVSIPAAEAYGAEGNPAQGIGPDEPLYFVVQLTGLTRTRTWCHTPLDLPPSERAGKPTKVELPKEFPPRVENKDIAPGEGKGAEVGDTVEYDFVAVSCMTGEQVETSWDQPEPRTVQLGVAQEVEGLNVGLVGAKTGMDRVIEIPASQAYGEVPREGSTVMPGDNLVFYVHIVKVTKPAATTTTAAGAATTTTAGG